MSTLTGCNICGKLDQEPEHSSPRKDAPPPQNVTSLSAQRLHHKQRNVILLGIAQIGLVTYRHVTKS